MATEYTSLKILGDRLLRGNVMKGITWDSIIDSTIDFIDIVGVPIIYVNKLYKTSFRDYRLELPCDYVEELAVEVDGVQAVWASDRMHNHYNKIDNGRPSNITFTTENRFMFFSKEKGNVNLSYKAILVDEEGYPMLPSNRTFVLALEWYIKVTYFTTLWEDGKIEDKRLENAKQEYAWAVGRLEAESNRLTMAKAEAMFNNLNTLIPRHNEFTHRFINSSAKEYIKSH